MAMYPATMYSKSAKDSRPREALTTPQQRPQKNDAASRAAGIGHFVGFCGFVVKD